MAATPKVLTLQTLLLGLIFFSWGLLFLSVALPGHHAFRKDFRAQNFLQSDQNQRLKKENWERKRNSCTECWSVSVGNGFGENKTKVPLFGRGKISAIEDSYYFFTLNAALTTLRVRLRMAQKVAGKRKKEVKDIECRAKILGQKLKSLLRTYEEKDFPFQENETTSPLQEKDTTQEENLKYPVLNIFSSIFHIFESSKNVNTSKSLKHVPFPKIAVIADERDSDIKLLLNSKTNGNIQYEFHFGINVSSSSLHESKWENNVHFYEFSSNASRGAVYNKLMRQVTAPFTLVASDLLYFPKESQIKRLTHYLREGNVWAVGTSLISPDNKWQSGCLQSHFKTFQAKLFRQNVAWVKGCMACSVLDGPFLALTPVLRALRWNDRLPNAITTVDLFLRAYHHHLYTSASCVDSVITSKKSIFSPRAREDLVELANEHRLKEVRLPHTPLVVLKCQEAKDVCRESGEMVSPCCLAELASMIKFFLATCEAHRLFCELQEGTLLGAVKFGGVLPWEKDGDVTFHTGNFSSIGELAPVFARAGFTLKLTDNRWCCVNGSEAGGEGKLIGDHWIVELYSQHAMDSEEMSAQRRHPTKVEINGGWVRSPTSPGEYARNRYGKNIYRHSQHWMDLGKLSGWEEYGTESFGPCATPGHHS